MSQWSNSAVAPKRSGAATGPSTMEEARHRMRRTAARGSVPFAISPVLPNSAGRVSCVTRCVFS